MISTLAEARQRLSAADMSDVDVSLPGDEPHEMRMGSLRLVEHDGAWDIVAWDYGMEVVLLRAPDLEEAVSYVVERWRTRPGLVRRVPPDTWRGWCEEMAGRVASLSSALDGGGVVETTLVPGSVVDRFGNLDGFLLYPAGTPMQRRSLPPSVLEPQRPEMGLVSLGVAGRVDVLARRVAPAFGQPGGGVLFRLAEESDTVRDLVARGTLEQVEIGPERAQS